MSVGAPLPCLVLLLLSSSCVEAERRPVASDLQDTAVDSSDAADSSVPPDTDLVPDVVEPDDGIEPDDVQDVEVEVGECNTDEDCELDTRTCEVNRCEAGTCVVRPAEPGTACDDGNPCTGDGQCDEDQECASGGPVADGDECDDGLKCNGVRTCREGVCEIAVQTTCATPTNPCAEEVATCSEEAGGICVETPKPDATPCVGPSGSLKPEQWQCSAGTCVPSGMVAVPEGRFTMGCPQGSCAADNAPAHTVELSRYAIDRDEVSEGMFQRCLVDSDSRGFQCKDRPGEGQGALVATPAAWPVRFVDWTNAATVCRYQGKRLCTEAEWERAARGAAEVRRYPWGNVAPTCARANFWDPPGSVGCSSGGPLEVGGRFDGASEVGARDMAGNVAEWVADYYRPDLYATRGGSVTKDPLLDTPYQGNESHVVRGGSYKSGEAELWTFLRAAQGSTITDGALGVRCCLTLDGP